MHTYVNAHRPEFGAITWNVYAGSSPDALEPHAKRERNHGSSVFLMQEAGGRGITPMLADLGMGTYHNGQWRVAWDNDVWSLVRATGPRLSQTEYYSVNHKRWTSNECALVTLRHRSGRTLDVLSYHTPAHVQVREAEQERVANRVQTTKEAMIRIGEIARASKADAFLAGGDDNWDEDTGIQTPIRMVRDYMLGRKTGLLQLQGGKATFGRREIDDFRILRRGSGIVPVGEPWVREGGGEERVAHKIHGRMFRFVR